MKSSFMGQSVLLRLHHFWHFFLHMKPSKHTSGAGRVNTWIFKSVPNLIVVTSLNSVNSGDSNGVFHVSIPALGDENRQLPCFCLPALPR